MKIAQEGIKELIEEVDSLITIPNQKLLEVLGEDCSMLEAFKQANDVLAGAVRGISDIIIKPGLINVDFADVKTVMSEKGTAMMGTGSASGPDRARIAAEQAVASKLLEDISLQDAKGVLVNITAGPELSLGEIKAVGDCISDFASDEAIIVTGTVLDENKGNDLVVTVIATGLSSSLQSIPQASRQASILSERKPLPLSDAARKMLENPPEVINKISKEEISDDDYLDIPSFVRKQLD
jgi:cell division protein FtsZ